jgi:hypothetical protein
MEKKTYNSDTTKFKIVAYWNVKPSGQYYSVIEKNFKQHRKYIDSFDYVATEGGKTITRHDEAFYKLLVYAKKNINRADKILIYMNDFTTEKQYLIANLQTDEARCKLIIPVFKFDELGIGHVYVNYLPCKPLETSVLIQKTIEKKPINILNS